MLCSIFGQHNCPAESVIREIMDRFRTTFTLVDNAYPQRCRIVSKKTRMRPSAIAGTNWSGVHPLCGRLCGSIWVCGLTKSNSCKNWTMELTFAKMGTLINKPAYLRRQTWDDWCSGKEYSTHYCWHPPNFAKYDKNWAHRLEFILAAAAVTGPK